MLIICEPFSEKDVSALDDLNDLSVGAPHSLSEDESYIDCARLSYIKTKDPSECTPRERAIQAMEYNEQSRCSSKTRRLSDHH